MYSLRYDGRMQRLCVCVCVGEKERIYKNEVVCPGPVDLPAHEETF